MGDVRLGESTDDAMGFVRESKRLLGDTRWNSPGREDEKAAFGPIAVPDAGIADADAPENRKASANPSVLLLSVAEFIEKNYTDPNLCLKGLGSAFKMSPEYLGKIFRKTYCISIADRITEIRLDKAAELILGTERSAGEILYSVGFDNESYFYRSFKRKYDMTPREYRLLSITGTAQPEKDIVDPVH